MYKEDLAWNNLQWLICLKTKSNQTKPMDANLYPTHDTIFKKPYPPASDVFSVFVSLTDRLEVHE